MKGTYFQIGEKKSLWPNNNILRKSFILYSCSKLLNKT